MNTVDKEILELFKQLTPEQKEKALNEAKRLVDIYGIKDK